MYVTDYLPVVARDDNYDDSSFWPPPGASMARASVRVADLIATQGWVDSDGVEHYQECREWDNRPIGVASTNTDTATKWLIMDGHHRAVAARIAGVTWVTVELWELDDGSDTDTNYPPTVIKPVAELVASIKENGQ